MRQAKVVAVRDLTLPDWQLSLFVAENLPVIALELVAAQVEVSADSALEIWAIVDHKEAIEVAVLLVGH